MGEQRNLTEENVEELKIQLDKMKEDNPDLEYNFFKSDVSAENDLANKIRDAASRASKWRDPLPEELNTIEFKAVWECIKKWDIATGLDKNNDGNDLYCGATGNHVVAILDCLRRVGCLIKPCVCMGEEG